MNEKELNFFNWLKEVFIRDNHPKYHKYYSEWLNNITQNQFDGFKKQYYYIINNLYENNSNR